MVARCSVIVDDITAWEHVAGKNRTRQLERGNRFELELMRKPENFASSEESVGHWHVEWCGEGPLAQAGKPAAVGAPAFFRSQFAFEPA